MLNLHASSDSVVKMADMLKQIEADGRHTGLGELKRLLHGALKKQISRTDNELKKYSET